MSSLANSIKNYISSREVCIQSYFSLIYAAELKLQSQDAVEVALAKIALGTMLKELIVDEASNLNFKHISNLPNDLKLRLENYKKQFGKKINDWHLLRINSTSWILEATKNAILEDYCRWIDSQVKSESKESIFYLCHLK